MPPVPEIPVEFAPQFNTATIQRLQATLISHCETLRDRFAILDMPLSKVSHSIHRQRLIDWREQFESRYAALYYPWLQIPDPLRLNGLLRAIPPSGYIAGSYAGSDRRSGVHQPPANTSLEGVKNLSATLNESLQGDLNQHNINVIRAYNGRGIRVAGARTLSHESQWRYINVRRLIIMIASAIEEQTQWLVFEPNSPTLHSAIDRAVRSLLQDLWQRGMLQGGVAEEAYYVRCDNDTNPPEEIDRGRVICEIGINPPWPAEFVIVRIGKTEGGLEILPEGGS